MTEIRSLLKLLLILIQSALLVLTPATSFASQPNRIGISKTDSGETGAQHFFLTTAPINSPQGDLHVEVQVFAIRDIDSLNSAYAMLQQQIQERPKTNDLVNLTIQSSNYQRSELATSTSERVDQLAKSIQSKNQMTPRLIETLEPDNTKNLVQNNVNLTLAFVRFFANSAVVSTGLIIGLGVPVPHALMVGLLAGSMSGYLQLKNAELFKWLSNSNILVNTASRLKLIPENPVVADNKTAKVLREIEMYGRWASIETAFLIVCQTAMLLLNIPITESLLLTVAKSTASQGIYELGILRFTDHLTAIDSKWAKHNTTIRNVAFFAGSGISVLSAIGTLAGLPFANVGFVLLGGTGLILNFAPRIMKSAPAERILSLVSKSNEFNKRILRRSVIKPKL